MNPGACGFFGITREMVQTAIAAFDTLTTAGAKSDSALSDIGEHLSALRLYRRAPRGWRRYVRRLKAAGQPVPALGLRRWSQRAAKRHRQHVERRVRTDAAKALRGMIDRAMCFGLEAR